MTLCRALKGCIVIHMVQGRALALKKDLGQSFLYFFVTEMRNKDISKKEFNLLQRASYSVHDLLH